MLPPDGSIHAFALTPVGAFSNFLPGESQCHWLSPDGKFENSLLSPEREQTWLPCPLLRAGKPMYVPTLQEHF